MALKDKYNFEYLTNEAEELILNELERQLEVYSKPLCLCNECVTDMAALALNTVKPLYRVSLLGSLYTASAMDEKSYATSVRDAVFKAIERIRKNPSHEIEQQAADKSV